jgi:hypothetical protein
MLAQFSKTELEVICMTVAVGVSHAMFSARFDRGAMSAADRFIGCAGRTVVEAVARPARTLPKKIKPTFVTAVTQALACRAFVMKADRLLQHDVTAELDT